MNSILVKTAKFKNLVSAYISSYLYSTPAFVRMIPTDKCNLNCKYCWQKDDTSKEMTYEEFSQYLEKAVSLKVGLITFLGGEPMVWESLFDAISLCSKKHVLSDLTTNGTLLDQKSIMSLGEAGLDYLNISVDSLVPSRISVKNSINRDSLIKYLNEAKSKFRMHFRFNSVIFKNNFKNIKELIEFSKDNNVQISLGFIVPPFNNDQINEQSIYFEKTDNELLQEITEYILEKKRNGYPIIDPDSYFKNIFRYLNREKFWDCNYPTRYGWINVTPNGKIRTCTKKMDELDIKFMDLDLARLKNIREIMKNNVKECNINCYSNCAYDSYFYTHYKLQMFKKILTRLKH